MSDDKTQLQELEEAVELLTDQQKRWGVVEVTDGEHRDTSSIWSENSQTHLVFDAPNQAVDDVVRLHLSIPALLAFLHHGRGFADEAGTLTRTQHGRDLYELVTAVRLGAFS
jgi:hypothetical protein